MQSFQGRHDKKSKFIPKSSFLRGMAGYKDYVFNMGSFAEFAIAQNTLLENFTRAPCYNLVEVPPGMGEISPRTGVLEPVVEVTFDFEEPIKANIVDRRIGPVRTKAEEDRLRRNLRANRDRDIGIYTQEELIERLEEIDAVCNRYERFSLCSSEKSKFDKKVADAV
jgi:hypothetical protein